MPGREGAGPPRLPGRHGCGGRDEGLDSGSLPVLDPVHAYVYVKMYVYISTCVCICIYKREIYIYICT